MGYIPSDTQATTASAPSTDQQPAGQVLLVRRKMDGQTGTLNASDFNPDKYEIVGGQQQNQPQSPWKGAADTINNSLGGKIGNALFARTGQFFGRGILAAADIAKMATPGHSFADIARLPPDQFKKNYPFLSEFSGAGQPNGGGAGPLKQFAGGAVGTLAEQAPWMSMGAGAVPATAAGRIGLGGAYGAAGAASDSLRNDNTPGGITGDQVGATVKGAVAGAAVSGFFELLAAAGDKLAQKAMDSTLNPFKKNIAQAERLVDDKTLSQTLLDNGVGTTPQTDKGLINTLKTKITTEANTVKPILEQNAKNVITGSDLLDGLGKEVVGENALSAEARKNVEKAVQKYADLYAESTFTPLDLWRERQGLGKDIGQATFTKMLTPSQASQVTAEKLVQRALYDRMRGAMLSSVGDEAQAAAVDASLTKMSALIDGRNLIQQAMTRGVKMRSIMGALGGGVLGALSSAATTPDNERTTGDMISSAAKGALITGVASAATASPLLKTTVSSIGNALGGIKNAVGNAFVNRIATGVGSMFASKKKQ